MNKDKLKWATFGLALGIIGGGIGAAGANKWLPGVTRFEKIEAREILIRNEAGERIAALGARKDGTGGLEIYTATGNVAASLEGAEGHGGGLAIYNAAGNKSVVLFGIESGGVLMIHDGTGKPVDIMSAGVKKLKDSVKQMTR